MKFSELENIENTNNKLELVIKNTNMSKARKPGDLTPIGLALLYKIADPSVWDNIKHDWQQDVTVPEFSYESGDNDNCKIIELSIKTPTFITNSIDMAMLNQEANILGFELAIQLAKFNYKSIILHDIKVITKEIKSSDSDEDYHSMFTVKLYFDAE